MTFQIHSLPGEDFASLFDLSDDELATRNAIRTTVKSAPGYPCRVSMKDADIGETVILTNHQHQPANSPYQSSHAVYVTKGAAQVMLQPGEVPDMIRSRLISLRMFSGADLIVDGDVLDGADLDKRLKEAFADDEVAYCHVHFAKHGCFAGMNIWLGLDLDQGPATKTDLFLSLVASDERKDPCCSNPLSPSPPSSLALAFFGRRETLDHRRLTACRQSLGPASA